MKNLIIAMLKFVFRKSCASIEKSAYNIGYRKAKQDSIDEREKFKNVVFEVNHPIGEFIIAVPNEHQDIIIGQIVAHDTIGKSNSPVAWVRDYVRGEDVMLWQKVYPYNESLAEVVSDLHPFNRHVLFYGTEKKFATVDENTIIGWGEMKDRLAHNGFFKAYEESKEPIED